MKGDFSRFTFDSKNRYSRVLMQQGRVQLDADWNEQLDISAYRTETEITDFIGHSGAPEYPKNGDQSTSFSITANDGNITIGKGRYYVKGMLFENNEDVAFNNQPDCPEETLPIKDKDGEYLVYLDVWQHHVTALEEPTLREAALGGADTTTRVKNVWRVKLHRLTASESKKPEDYTRPDWQPTWETPISTGELTAWVKQAGAIAENQLYRVEIHQGNATDTDQNEPAQNKTATFKWSQDNGAIAAQVGLIDRRVITIQKAGRDSQLAFPINGLVELSNANRSLRGEPGILATVRDVQGNRLTVDWKTPDQQPPANSKDFTVIRHWDCNDAIDINPDDEYSLKQSITVKFRSGTYKMGDYWLIPARALTGNIEWPSESKSQPPHDNTRHYYCSLALVALEGNKFSFIADCRSIFKPVTSGLLNKAGDTMTGNLTIDQNLSVKGNIDIGGTAPEQKVVIANGKVAIGYNDTNHTAALAVSTNVGIGEIDPIQKLVVTGGKAAIGYNDINQTTALAVNGNVGIGISKLVAPFTTARLVVQSEHSNGGTPKSDPEAVLSLVRDGSPDNSWCNIVNFQIGRYDDGLKDLDKKKGNLLLRSRTQLDISLSHGNYDAPETPEWSQNIMTLRSNGNVGIGTTNPKSMLSVAGGVAIGSDYTSSNTSPTDGLIVKGNVGIGTPNPQVKLEINGDINITGKIGNWAVTRSGSLIMITIKRRSYNNLVPVNSPHVPIGNIYVSLAEFQKEEKPEEFKQNRWIATCQAISPEGVVVSLTVKPSSDPTIERFEFNTKEFGGSVEYQYALVTVCLASIASVG